jgi:predicted KAP-like P-loop ATPase
MSGFDSPLDELDDDRFDRRRLARQIYSLLTDLKADWSVRVGLFGAWGAGKTSIGLWVAKLAKIDGHIPIWFNPWSVRSLAELWTRFAESLFRAFDEEGIKLEGTKRIRAALAIKDWKELPEKIAEVDSRAKAVVGAASFVADALLKITPQDLEQIRKRLGERRVIVIIDDLDRTDPSLLPQLFLALRELLDRPGFSFLLPFEKSKIVTALQSYNESWDGDAFLEKILDFRFALPEPTPEQLRNMFMAEMKGACPFVPASELVGFDTMLPSTPRKLKLLVRHIATSFRSRAARAGRDRLVLGNLRHAAAPRKRGVLQSLRARNLRQSRPQSVAPRHLQRQ